MIVKQKMPKNRTQRNNGKNRNNCKNRRFFVDFCNAVTDVNSFAYFVSIVWEKSCYAIFDVVAIPAADRKKMQNVHIVQ